MNFIAVLENSTAWSVLAAFIVSLGTTSLIALGIKMGLGLDHHEGVQKFHQRPTSRLGGVGIILGLLAGIAVCTADSRAPLDADFLYLATTLCLCAIPVFLGGLAEDLTRRVGPSARLLLAIISALALYWFAGVGVLHTDVFLVDWLLNLPIGVPLISLLLTTLVVAGFTNGTNIIDGFHGLAGGSVLIMIAGLFGLSCLTEDWAIAHLCAVLGAVTLGFLVLNWPMGRIFLGDAGAYLLGFCVVETGLWLILRNPEISPMAPVLIGTFPLVETLFSMYRRKFVRSHPINHPDALHLHTLIYRRMIARPNRRGLIGRTDSANALVAIYFWIPGIVLSLTAIVWRHQTPLLLTAVAGYSFLYLWLYRRVVSLRTPVWMSLR
jgi:UDP-N-acetylmuramyl pentapeptide phosphotransferase/UDP-N-acetylglucosamine-1-phosphate transferase